MHTYTIYMILKRLHANYITGWHGPGNIGLPD